MSRTNHSYRWCKAVPATARLACFLCAGLACVHVPPEAPQLSLELTGRIEAVKAAHLQAVRLYLNEKRADVDRFIEQEWLPQFAKTALESEAVQKVLEPVCRSDRAAERVEALVGLGTRLQLQLNKKRTELMQPVDEFERTLTQELEKTYDQMRAMNATLTGLLQAHADTTKTQAAILERLQLSDRLATTVGEADKIVGYITSGRDAIEKNRSKIDDVLKALKGK